MSDMKCAIWGTPAEEYPRTSDGRDIFSARAGGRYRITGTALLDLQHYLKTDALKAKLSLRIADSQNLDQPILITENTLQQVASWPDIRPFDKANRLLRVIESNTTALNVAGLCWGGQYDPAERDRALATAGLTKTGELDAVLGYLDRKGFCRISRTGGNDVSTLVFLTLEGAEEVAAPVPASLSNQAFIAMWFSDQTQAAFDEGIKPALGELGFDARRIDQKEHNNKIDDEIIAEIRQSRFLVADFTCGTIDADGKGIAIARGGVYFEAGFAMGLGIPVIWCCREDLVNQVHFDTRQYNHITWNTPEELREKLKNRVGAVIGSYTETKHS